MKNFFLKLTLPVILVSLITLSAFAQTKPSNTAYTNKKANLEKYNNDFTNWQQKVSTFKTKYAKNEDAQDDTKTIIADLGAYKKAISAYSSSKSANASDANDAVKAAKDQLNTDYTAAKTKLAPVKKPASAPAKSN